MKFRRFLPAWLFAILAVSCVAPDDTVETDDNDDAETSPLDAKSTSDAYSPWITYASTGGYPNIQFRACKTSTTIYWQFQNNHGFTSVTTRGNPGSSMIALTSNIAGVSAGSKYRTRGNATWFNVQYNGAGIALITGQPISQIPSC